MDNFMKLSIKAVSANESFARSAVAAFCVDANPTVDELGDVKTAVSEAVTNSIVHGYAGQSDGVVEIYVTLCDGRVHIEVKDCGVGIADIEQARTPFYTTKPEEERSGMGFTVMESFMDSLEVEQNAPHGVIVRMEKQFASKTPRE
ncbi:MAG: anti-sigma F factor [Clostridiales bacterium]|nr:anti-sigma F factor [Clostridiales bacterium]